MSLTANDLQEIRTIVRDVVSDSVSDALQTEGRSIIREEVGRQVESLAGEIKALRNDIKEIYDMIAELQKGVITDKEFKKKTLEQKLLTINAELLSAAKQAGITLPR